ncbi:MAG TPA: TonB-dependent receptor [Rhizomicrobium sp.]|nr:TonB-dependent receptor [Rhizomicrobium sp.]
MHTNSRFFLSVALAALSAAPAFADDSADSLDTIVVTATRTAQPLGRTGESVSVLDSETLHTLQTVSVADALALTPGVVIDQSGGLGQPTTVSIRGAETGQTLVLIDGVRINDPSGTDGGAILGDVLANNIDRIEVLRGSQSTLYGSDAIGGVIDIFSKHGGDTPFALNASAEGGSFDTYHLNAAANGTADNIDYGAAANYIHSNGISAADSRNGNPETDGYANLGLTENVRVHVTDSISLDVRSYYTNARDDFDDNSSFTPPYLTMDSAAYNTNRFLMGYAGLNVDLFGGMFHNRFAVMHTQSDREFYDSAFDTIHKNDEDKGRAMRFEYQGVVDAGPDTQITFGAETEHTSFISDYFNSFAAFDSFNKGSKTTSGFYAQAQSTFFDALTLTGGVRYDDDDQFGHHVSEKVSAAYDFHEGTVLHANYGTGFKAPSLYELFSSYGNLALHPEESRGWEAGVDQAFWDDRLHGTLTYFARRTNNLIDFASCFVASPPPECSIPAVATAGGFYDNIGRTRADGVEAELAAKITDTLAASLNYTNLDARDLEAHDTLPRRPRNRGSAIVTWAPYDNWSVGGSVSYTGREIDQYDTTTTPPTAFINGGHTVVGLFGEYKFDQWSLYGRIDNLFNQHYEPLIGYGAPGRAFYAGIRVNE